MKFHKAFLSKNRISWTRLNTDTALATLEAIDTTFSKHLINCLKNGEMISKPNPNDYMQTCTDDFGNLVHTGRANYITDMQAYAIVGKNTAFSSTNKLLPKLVSDFFDSEKQNAIVNKRFELDQYSDLTNEIRNNVAKILGSSFPFLPDEPLMGPGTSYHNHGERVNPIDKLSNGKVALTQAAIPFWEFYSRTTSLNSLDVVTIRSNFFSSVPKSINSLRTICVENEGNMALQKWLGNAIRFRLGRFYDLSKQHAVHKSIVARASITRSHATIDIKNASNSICSGVVKALVPAVWFHALSSLRAPATQIGNYVHENELFSSMGNGFTFELETVIFLAICMSLKHNRVLSQKNNGDISVFGDDIICRDTDVEELIDKLNYFGFTVNVDKSFYGESYFRESCGADFFAGVDTTPIYFRGGDDDENNITSYYVLLNKLFLLSHSLFGSKPELSRFSRVYASIIRIIPKKFRYYGPPDFFGRPHLDSTIGSVEHHCYIYSDDPIIRYDKCQTFVLAFSPQAASKALWRTSEDGCPVDLYPAESIILYALMGYPSRGSPLRRRTSYSRTFRFYLS